MIAFGRAFHDPRYDDICFVCCSHMGKTQMTLAVLGQRADQDPVPMIYVGPVKTFIEEQFEPRVKGMIDSCLTLKRKSPKGIRQKQTLKRLASITLRLAWAGSASQLSLDPAGLCIVDERDRMEKDVKGEGDPVVLVKARGETYADFKTLKLPMSAWVA